MRIVEAEAIEKTMEQMTKTENNMKCVIGTNSWGSKAYEKAIRGSYVDDTVIEEAVNTALDLGLTVFDTAEDYGFGYAQKLLGRLRKMGMRDTEQMREIGQTREAGQIRDTAQMQISAKYTPVGKYRTGQVRKAFERDCRDMQTDFVDYYWLHLPNDIDRNLEEMADLYREGRIGHIGVSNFNLREAKHAKAFLESHGASLYGVQNHFSLLERSEEENGMLEWCRENHIAFWGWAALEEGVLTGNPKGPSSVMGLLFKRKTSKLRPLFALMQKIGDKYGFSVAQVAIAYCAAKGVIPICGCRKAYQVEDLARAVETDLSTEDVTALEKEAAGTGVKILKTDIFRFMVRKGSSYNGQTDQKEPTSTDKKEMSISGKAAMALLRTGRRIVKIEVGSPEKFLEESRIYNEKHKFHRLRDHKVIYKYYKIGGCPCIRIRSKRHENIQGKAILYLHGGARNDWEAEIMVARGYANHTGIDVWFPIYPAVTETGTLAVIDSIYEIYRKISTKYGAENTALIGTSFGGTFGFELIHRINMDGNKIKMPALYIANSPGGLPDHQDEWREMERYAKYDPLLSIESMKSITEVQRILTPDLPKWAYCPAYENFSNAPETYVYYGEETCAGNHLAYERGYEKAGVRKRLHMHIEPGMMHGYSCLPIFPESKRAYAQQVELLTGM